MTKTAGRKPTKLQRMNAAAKKSKERRVAKALKAYVDAALGKGRYAGATVKKNPGGSITIVPVKISKKGTR